MGPLPQLSWFPPSPWGALWLGRPGSSAARRPGSRSDQQMVPEAGGCRGLG